LISGSTAGHRGPSARSGAPQPPCPRGAAATATARRRTLDPAVARRPSGCGDRREQRGSVGVPACPRFNRRAAWRGQIGSTPAARAQAKTGTPGRGAGTTPTPQRDRPWTFPPPAPRFPVSASRSRCWRPGCWSPSRSGAIR
jgi:hypothetical protein